MRLTIPEILGELTHLNTRKEMHGDESKLACDLDFSILLPATETLEQLTLGETGPLLEAFWTEDGKVREPTIKAIKMNHKLESHVLKLTIGIGDAIESDDVTLKKFSWHPENGGTIRLHFQASLNPTEEQLAEYARGLETNVSIAIDPPRQMDISQIEDEEAEDATKKSGKKAAA